MLLSYFQFLFASTNHHGIHSPFVFSLVTECFYNRKLSSTFSLYNDFRNDLKTNNSYIVVNDFGAGSKKFKTNKRKVNDIAKYAGISRKRAKLLFKIVRYFQIENVLEIGTSLGLGTAAIYIANPKAKIITIEGCTETSKIAEEMFKKYDLSNITLINDQFEKVLSEQTQNKSYDLVVFDGNHTKEATLAYFYQCLEAVHNESVFIFDDIHWDKQMEEAWEVIKANPKVSVTIDTFQWGLVFFRKEQAKEHFIIRV